MKYIITTLSIIFLMACKEKNKEQFVIASDITSASPLPQEKIIKEEHKEPSGVVENAIGNTTNQEKVASKEPQAPIISNEKNISLSWDKKIIKTANVNLELSNYNSYNSLLHNSIKNYGAYIASEEQNSSDDKIENNIVIKVPVEKFEDLLNSFNGKDIKLLEKKITSEDVTNEVYDTKGRIEAKKQIRATYLELLKQAKSMKDILEVQQEINTIQEDLESASSRVEFLNHQSSYSTIHLKYFQLLTPKAIDNTGFLFDLKNAFGNGASFCGSLFLGLVSIWPLIIVGLLGFYFAKKYKSKFVKNIVK